MGLEPSNWKHTSTKERILKSKTENESCFWKYTLSISRIYKVSFWENNTIVAMNKA